MRAFSGSVGRLRYFNWSSRNNSDIFSRNISIGEFEILTSEGRRSQQSRLSERSTFPGPGIIGGR